MKAGGNRIRQLHKKTYAQTQLSHVFTWTGREKLHFFIKFVIE